METLARVSPLASWVAADLAERLLDARCAEAARLPEVRRRQVETCRDPEKCR
jgi:hypothetical protein